MKKLLSLLPILVVAPSVISCTDNTVSIHTMEYIDKYELSIARFQKEKKFAIESNDEFKLVIPIDDGTSVSDLFDGPNRINIPMWDIANPIQKDDAKIPALSEFDINEELEKIEYAYLHASTKISEYDGLDDEFSKLDTYFKDYFETSKDASTISEYKEGVSGVSEFMKTNNYIWSLINDNGTNIYNPEAELYKDLIVYQLSDLFEHQIIREVYESTLNHVLPYYNQLIKLSFIY